MTDFRAKRAPVIPGKAIQPVANAKPAPPAGRQKRRGVRVNSRVPICVEWQGDAGVLRKEGQTRVVGPYGCMAILPINLEVKQRVQLTNMVSKQTNPAIVVWCGIERPEGFEAGIELLDPQMGFWEFEL